ncbi:MAG: PaaI family thioesterase [Bacilli bacterium]|mgnify:FL=1|nr:PaaI family thioesterase [Bacilli bacterium]
MEEVKHAVQDEYADDFSWCYGCGRLNENGLHVRTGWDGDKTVSYYTPREDQIAVPGVVYGGLIASIVDCHSTGSASLALHRKNGHEPGSGVEPPRFVTASLHVDYLKPTPHGVTLKLVGTVEEIHPKRFRVLTEVMANGEVCAKGDVVAVVIPDGFMDK